MLRAAGPAQALLLNCLVLDIETGGKLVASLPILSGLPVEYHSACGIALPALSLSLQRTMTFQIERSRRRMCAGTRIGDP